jgi:hypothetical protein
LTASRSCASEAAVARGRQLIDADRSCSAHAGREFNVGVVGSTATSDPAGRRDDLHRLPDDMPRIVGWEASGSRHFSYDQTERAFTDEEKEPELVAAIREITQRC